MTTATINFLAYKEFTPRQIQNLPEWTAKLHRPAFDKAVEPKHKRVPILTELKYCYPTRSGRRVVVCVAVKGGKKYIGTAADYDEAKVMQDEWYSQNAKDVLPERSA